MGMIQTTIWHSMNGAIDIKDMEDEHIVNTIALLERRRDTLRTTIARTGTKQLTRYLDATDSWIRAFLKELKRREKTGEHVERRVR